MSRETVVVELCLAIGLMFTSFGAIGIANKLKQVDKELYRHRVFLQDLANRLDRLEPNKEPVWVQPEPAQAVLEF